MAIKARNVNLDDVAEPIGRAMFNWMSMTRTMGHHQRVFYAGCNEVLGSKFTGPNMKTMTREVMYNDFAHFHAMVLIATWSALESFVDDVVIDSLKFEPSLLSTDPFAKLNVPATALALEQDQALRLVVHEAKTSVSQKRADTRFEPLLRLVGLDGKTPTHIRRVVAEAYAVRNVWAHRAGFADENFIKSPFGRNVEVGQQIGIGQDELKRLLDGLHMYVTIILCRHQPTRDAYVFEDAPAYDGTLKQAGFEWDSAPDTSDSTSDAPPA